MSHKNDPAGVRESGDDRTKGLFERLVDRLRRHDREWADSYVEMRFEAER